MVPACRRVRYVCERGERTTASSDEEAQSVAGARRRLHLIDEGQTWRGLLFDVSGRDGPSLRVETGASRRFRLVQDERPVAWCRIRSDWYGVEVVHDQPLAPVIEPMRAATAREVSESDPAKWFERWAYRVIDSLTASTSGPVHSGRWTIRPVGDLRDVPADHLVPLDGMSPLWVELDPELIGAGVVELGWDPPNDGAPLLPLRPLSEPDDGRVKAYRKLVAARAQSGWSDLDEIARFERVLKSQPKHYAAHEALARRIVQVSAYVEEVPSTLAWPSGLPDDAWPSLLR